MKKTLRVLSGVLILVLICAVLSGCSILERLLHRNKEKETATQEVTTTAAAEPETTKEAVTEPATASGGGGYTDGQEVYIDADMQYEANIFLSNFAEQYGFTDFDIYSYSGQQVVDFAHRFAKINEYGAISYDSLYEVITLDYVNGVLNRFFGLTLSASDYIDFPAPTYSFDSSYHGPYYKDGLFYYDMADGATFTQFAVVYQILSFSDGHLEMAFRRYDRLDFYDSIGGLAVTDAHYHLTLAEAEADPNLLNIGNGYAKVYPKVYNGHNTYQLIEYHEYGLGGIEDY